MKLNGGEGGVNSLPQRRALTSGKLLVAAVGVDFDVDFTPDLTLPLRGLTAETAYVEAWRDYWLARVRLEKELGGALPSAAVPFIAEEK